MEIDFKKLREPFMPFDVEWRIQQAGQSNGKIWAKVLCYVTNRAIMDRLDEVAGPGNWQNHFNAAPGGGVMCGISIKIGGEWVTKWDGADNTQVEAVKGGLSGSMKRAGVQWGIGRYLYKLEEGWAECFPDRSSTHKGSFKDKQSGKTVWFTWNPPALPQWALPEVK